MRLAFMGSPEFALPTLEALLAAGHEIVAVYSQPAKPSGRGQILRPTPVAARAQALGLPVFTPKSLKGAVEHEAFAALGLDGAIVVAYGLILPRPILEAPRLGCFNLHGSLLPRWRGAAPMQRAIEAGDTETGVQVMAMEEGLDTGAVYLTHREPITDHTTADDLHDMLAAAGGPLMVRALAGIEAGTLIALAQVEEGVTYARKIERPETRLDWTMPASVIVRKIHAFSPFPGAWFELQTPKGPVRMKALRAEIGHGSAEPGTVIDGSFTISTADQAVRLLRVQRDGKGPSDAADFLRGTLVPVGTVLA